MPPLLVFFARFYTHTQAVYTFTHTRRSSTFMCFPERLVSFSGHHLFSDPPSSSRFVLHKIQTVPFSLPSLYPFLVPVWPPVGPPLTILAGSTDSLALFGPSRNSSRADRDFFCPFRRLDSPLDGPHSTKTNKREREGGTRSGCQTQHTQHTHI